MPPDRREKPGGPDSQDSSSRFIRFKEMVQILDHLADGCGVRKTARLTGRSRNTVARYSELAGQQAKAVQDELAAFSPTDARSAGG